MAGSDRKTRARLEFLEWEARSRPRRHKLRLVGLALLGYLYPAALVVVSFGLVVALLALGPLAWSTLHDFTILLYVGAVLGAAVLTFAVLSSFRVALPEPDGHPLGADDAAPLRTMVEEVRRAVGAPPVHRIHVDARFNAAAGQRQRFGFWGRTTNYVFVGIPLLASLTPEQLRLVLAHELGHLIGRHNSFTAWVYRVQQTWATLQAPFAKAPWLRRAVMGWFVAWYGPYFSYSTLALRRLHEYEADRRSASAGGPEAAARTLAAIAWGAYRLERQFWPELFRESGRTPLPPADVLGRIAQLFASPPRPGTAGRWRRRERSARTPVTVEHPCLAERLEALGCRAMLESASEDEVVPGVPAALPPEASALPLLGEARQRLTAVANASWKAEAIVRWRAEHASAKAMREAAAKRAAAPAAGNGEGDGNGAAPPEASPRPEAKVEWERVQAEAEYSPTDQAEGLLRDFLARFPGHGDASYALGRLLIQRDEDEAAEHLEAAMRADSDTIGSSLHMLLDHYRETGRDAEADAVRERFEAFQQDLTKARTERLKVARGDRFLPHDLNADEVEKIRRLLYRHPQVKCAYLARKQVRHFGDKKSYVLAVRRRAGILEDRRRADRYLIESLRAQVEQPCAVVILGATSRGLRNRLMKVCPSPVFEAND